MLCGQVLKQKFNRKPNLTESPVYPLFGVMPQNQAELRPFSDLNAVLFFLFVLIESMVVERSFSDLNRKFVPTVSTSELS